MKDSQGRNAFSQPLSGLSQESQQAHGPSMEPIAVSHGEQLYRLPFRLRGATGETGIQRTATGQTECPDTAPGGIHLYICTCIIFSLVYLHPVQLERVAYEDIGAACVDVGALSVCL